MIKSKSNTIVCWRGDIVASGYALSLVSTATLRDYVYEGLKDSTPKEVVITLTIPLNKWQALPVGEYNYTIASGGEVIACGIFIKEGAETNDNEYNNDVRYVEYNG